jgi:flagellar biosynthetic protein FliR
MSLDASLLWSFFVVFVRASAMFLSSPIFSGTSMPVQVRVMSTLSISAALTMAVQRHVGPVPQDLLAMVTQLANEAVAGLVIGVVVSLVFQAIQMAGSFLDFQVGLGSSQIINPVTGVPVTILAQVKYLLAIVVFLTLNGHHAMIRAFIESYRAFPMLSMGSLEAMQTNMVGLLTDMSLLSLQIAAPVVAVSLIVDAALGIVNKAVPQMQVFMVGMPAKVMLGLITLSVTLPVLVAGVENGVSLGLDRLWTIWQEAK